MAVAPPTNPAEAFGAGDPRNANYFQTLAQLEHQEQSTLAGLNERESSARSAATYRQGLLGQQEPQSYKANQHRANAGGIAESGVNAERRGTIATDYANKRYAVTNNLQNTENQIGRARQQAKEAREAGEGRAANTALGEGYKSLLENPPAPENPAGSVPAKVTSSAAGTVTVGGRPGPPVSIAREVGQPSTAGVRRSAGASYLAKLRAKGRV